jgi:hypothetical protein
MRRRLATIGLAIVTATSARPARAQSGVIVGAGLAAGYGVLSIASIARLLERPRTARPGDAVRIVVMNGRQRTSEVRGTLGESPGDSIVVDVDGAPSRFALRDIPFLAVDRGDERKWAQGWAIGLGSGVVAGAVGGFASGDDTHCDILCFSAQEKALILGIAGGVTGSVVGAAIGGLVVGHHWTSVNRLRESRMALSPVIGRTTGLSARITF